MKDGAWTATASAFAVVAIGRALEIANGFLSDDALFWISAALVVAALGTILPRPASLERLDIWLAAAIGCVGILWNLVQLSGRPPILVPALAQDQQSAFTLRVAALAVAAAFAAAAGFTGRVRLLVPALVLVAAHVALGIWTLHLDPNPSIDVHLFHTRAIAALRRGRNPYALTTPNIYGDSPFYGPGLVVDGRLQVGFPYFPLGLLLVAPGQIIGGDYRYAELAAMNVAALMMAFAWRRNTAPRLGLLAAALFLTTPRIFFVLDQGWTDPLMVFGLAAVLYVAYRDERALPWIVGAFLAIKQYSVLALPSAFLLIGQTRRSQEVGPVFRPAEALRFFGKAFIVGFVVTVPFLVWAPAGFWRSVVAFQFRQPFRMDSLSYLSWWAAHGHPPPSEAIGFIVAAVASAISVWRLPRTPAGFAFSAAITSLAFFAFNKQAFCNYYFFVTGAFAVALAGCSIQETTPRTETV